MDGFDLGLGVMGWNWVGYLNSSYVCVAFVDVCSVLVGLRWVSLVDQCAVHACLSTYFLFITFIVVHIFIFSLLAFSFILLVWGDITTCVGYQELWE